MKKFIAIFLLVFMALSLCACEGTNSESSADSSAESSVSVSSEAASSEAESSEVEEGGYVVTVVDMDNNPISGLILQMCKLGDDGSCTAGNPTDADGKVRFNLPEDEYKVSFLIAPNGYTHAADQQEYYFEEGSTELTIKLVKVD